MKAGGMAGDLAWWRANREAPDAEAARVLLERLRAWKSQHDAERARQPPPFLRMAWDGVFGDEDERVSAAIAELEAALGEAPAQQGS